MGARTRTPGLILALTLMVLARAAAADPPALSGHWVISAELTRAAQPDGPQQKNGLFERMPRASVSVGGMPLPGSAGAVLPSAPGSPQDPRILRCHEMLIDAGDETLRIDCGEAGSEVLQRGNDQGLVSRWSNRKLTSRYETSSRKVSQTYQVRRDGTLLVTVKLDPNDSAAVVHKRVFQRAPAGPAGGA